MGNAQEQQVTFFGETEPVVEIRGSSWVGDWTSIGWSVGTYSDQPNKLTNFLYVYNYGPKDLQIQPGSKLILKVNDLPMVLTTSQGTYYEGSTKTFLRYSDVMGYVNVYETAAFYEITQEQVDLINTYGITKYRYQVADDVYTRDGMNNEKIAKKMKKVYDRISTKQLKYSKDINDLSDF